MANAQRPWVAHDLSWGLQPSTARHSCARLSLDEGERAQGCKQTGVQALTIHTSVQAHLCQVAQGTHPGIAAGVECESADALVRKH